MKNLITKHKIYFSIYLIFMALSAIIIFSIDKQLIHETLNTLNHTYADYFFKYITHIGDGLSIVIVSIVLLFISKRMFLQVAVSGIIAGAIAQFLKKVVFGAVLRPSAFFQELKIPLHYVDGVDLHSVFSFPSGHSTTIFALTTSLVLITKTKKYDIFLIATAIIVAYSRVYLSQHFLIDILIGSIIGLIISILVNRIFYSPKILTNIKLDLPLINFPIK